MLMTAALALRWHVAGFSYFSTEPVYEPVEQPVQRDL
jgi:hypothetical protein